MKMKSKNILITGVSTGIGYDLAKVFLDHDYVVYGSVRKKEDAERLSSELGSNFHAIIFDVTDHEAIDRVALELEAQIGEEGLGGLINNAGTAIAGPFIDLSVDDFRSQFEINVFGLIKVTQAFLPLLGARENHSFSPGRIIQISSIAGKQGMPYMSPYSGSKHALEGITESMRKELLYYGIDVILIEPGPIKTPIWNKAASEEIETRFKDSVYFESIKKYRTKFIPKAVKRAWTSEKASKIIFKAFKAKRPRVRYLIIAQKFMNWTLPRLLPTRFLDKLIAKLIGLIK